MFFKTPNSDKIFFLFKYYNSENKNTSKEHYR